ncbi:MAG: hypothetical protein NVSMB5_09390 [Candidatus Velthaea sp.]
MRDKAILDLSRLQGAFDDDVTGIADLLEMALETGAKHLHALHAGLQSADLGAVSRAAHSIKGSTSNIGANSAALLASDIESRARSGTWDGIAALADELDRAYSELRASVAAYRAEIS